MILDNRDNPFALPDELAALSRVSIKEVIAKLPISWRDKHLIIEGRDGRFMDLDEYMSRRRAAKGRYYFAVLHERAYPLIEALLRENKLPGLIGMNLASVRLIQYNAPDLRRAYHHEQLLTHVVKRAFMLARRGETNLYAKEAAGVIWQPADQSEFRKNAIELAKKYLKRKKKRLIYMIPHSLPVIPDPEKCYRSDLAAMRRAGIDLTRVMAMADVSAAYHWTVRRGD